VVGVVRAWSGVGGFWLGGGVLWLPSAGGWRGWNGGVYRFAGGGRQEGRGVGGAGGFGGRGESTVCLGVIGDVQWRGSEGHGGIVERGLSG